MRTAFGDLLARLIAEQGFASAHAYATKAGLAPSYIYKILDGKCPPPSKHLAVMADLLTLNVKDRYLFVLTAALTHVPDRMGAMVIAFHRSSAVSSHELHEAFEASLGTTRWNLSPRSRRYKKRRVYVGSASRPLPGDG